MFGPLGPVGGRVTLCGVFVAGMLLAGSAGSLTLAAAEGAASIPDFQIANDVAWREIGDEFLPPPSGPGPVTNDPKHPFYSNGAQRLGKTPTYHIGDLSNPILQPWAVEQMRKDNEAVLAGGVAFRPNERCIPGGVPEFVLIARISPFYFFQTPREVTILNQNGPEIRRVFMNVPHSEHVKPSWYGESVGHYDGGDTLVVDTIGISTKSYVDNFRTPHTEKLHVVERFKISSAGGNRLRRKQCEFLRKRRSADAGGRQTRLLITVPRDPTEQGPGDSGLRVTRAPARFSNSAGPVLSIIWTSASRQRVRQQVS